MAGWLHLKVDVIKGGMAKYGIKNPIFKPSPIVPTYNDYLIFEGISVDEQGKQYYLDVHIAYRQACLNAIEYLTKFGYPAETTEAFCDGHVRAFAFFGGVPKSILYDNTKIAVARILGDGNERGKTARTLPRPALAFRGKALE
jgi:hypothetical protein